MTHLAYMITAYHQPNQFGRMVRALYHSDDYYFIHVDAKVDIRPFQEVVPEAENIIFLASRRRVYWGASVWLKRYYS